MKKFFTLLVALCATMVQWASGACVNGIYYELNHDSATASVVSATSYSSTAQYTGDIIIPDSIIFSGTTYRVNSIANSAFYECLEVTSVKLPNSIKSIGAYAFFDCAYIPSITVPSSVTAIGKEAFAYVRHVEYGGKATGSPWGAISVNGVVDGYLVYSDENKTKLNACLLNAIGAINIASSVTSIGDRAFYHCKGITSVNIPNGVTAIGDYTFAACDSLQSVNIPNGVTSFGTWAFFSCDALKSISIPNGVTTIGKEAFAGCGNLTTVTIPNTVDSIGENAFEFVHHIVYNGTAAGSPWGAYSKNGIVDGIFVYRNDTKTELLTCLPEAQGDITIPNHVKKIGESAFRCLNNITSVTMGDSVTSIGENTFSVCQGLQSIKLSNSLTYIGMYAFSGCKNLRSIILPPNLNTIAGMAFCGCLSLKSINIPDQVYYVGSGAFEDCIGLKNVNIGKGVSNIGASAFKGCTGISSIIIPESVSTIGASVFSGCTTLTNVVWNAKNCPNFSSEKYAPFRGGLTNITSFTFGNSVQRIPAYLCYGMTELNTTTFGGAVNAIGASAFSGCTKLLHITCYAQNPPNADNSSFANYNVFLNVPCNNLMSYQTDVVFGSFKYIQCIGSEESTVTGFTISGGQSDATFEWPASTNAETYTMTITKDGVVFSTLTFNAQGQLVNIAFAPARGASNTQEAEQTANGFKFTVTGLNSDTEYGYEFKALDGNKAAVATYTGTFNTTATGLEEIEAEGSIVKYIENGKLYIMRNGVKFDASGRVVK